MRYNYDMKREQKKALLTYTKSDAIALALNICLVIFEVVGLALRIHDNAGVFGVEYYTQDSNLLLLLICAVTAFFIVRKMVNGKEIPRVVSIIKLSAVVALLITFLIVAIVLAPIYGLPYGFKLLLFTRAMFFTHLTCPLLALLSFLVFEKHEYEKKDLLWAQVYTLLYAIVLIILNLVHVVDGPYPFLQVCSRPVWQTILWSIGILGGAYGITWLLCKIRRRK